MPKQQKVQKLLFKVNKPAVNAGTKAGLVAADFSADTIKDVVAFAKSKIIGWVANELKPLTITQVTLDTSKTSPFHDVLVLAVEDTTKKNSSVSFKCHVDIGRQLDTAKANGKPKILWFNGITVRVPSFTESGNIGAGLLSQNAVKIENKQLDVKQLAALFKTAYSKAREVARAERNRVKTIIASRQKAFEVNSEFRAKLHAMNVEFNSAAAAAKAYSPILAPGGLKWNVLSQDFSIKFAGLSDEDKLSLHVLLAANGFSELLTPLSDKNTEYDSVMDEGLPLYDVFERYYPEAVAERKAALERRFAKKKK